MRIGLFLLVGILSTGIGAYVAYAKFKPGAPVSTVASALFSQSLPDAAGSTVALDQYRGKPLIVNFWATWCPPCVEEMPELAALQTELNGGRVRTIGIGIDSATNIAQFAGKHPVNYPLLVAGMSGTELSRQFGNTAGGLPFTVLLDSAGRVQKTYLGRVKVADLRRDALSTP